MSYARSVLQPGETVLATGWLHWIIYRWAILSAVLGVVVVWLESVVWPHNSGLIVTTAWLFAALFVVTFAYAWFIRWITEFAVTNRRVILSKVFIARNTEEMTLDKVETVDVHQSILGRILGYGTMWITGTGGSTNNIEVTRMGQLFALRNAILMK
jgi:uncharacterized membrane protein YdbT with pleckstrin-like domain